MAQSSVLISNKDASIIKLFRNAANAAVSVPTGGNTTLLQIPLYGLERVFVQFDVSTNNLDAFLIRSRASEDASTVTLYSTASDYTAPAGLLLGASGDLTTVAAGSSGWFIMDVRGLWDLTVQASATGGAASVSIYAGGR